MQRAEGRTSEVYFLEPECTGLRIDDAYCCKGRTIRRPHLWGFLPYRRQHRRERGQQFIREVEAQTDLVVEQRCENDGQLLSFMANFLNGDFVKNTRQGYLH